MRTLQNIADAKEAFRKFAEFKPEIYIYVEGGNIQGASANCQMAVEIYDEDLIQCGPDENEQEYTESNGTPEEWSKMIDEETAKGNLTPVY